MLSLSPPLPPPPAWRASSHDKLVSHQPLFVDTATLVNAINSCAAKRDIFTAASLHAATVKSGVLHSNIIVANAFVDVYAKCEQMDHASKVFDQMSQKDIVSWTSLISGYCRNGSATSSLSVFLEMISDESAPAPNEFTITTLLQACALVEEERMGRAMHGYCFKRRFFDDVFVCSSLIGMYSKLGISASAEKLLYGLRRRDVASWTAIISGCVLRSMFSEAIQKFAMMLEDAVLPNFVTMLSIIQACSLLNEARNFGWVHAWILKLELCSNSLLSNSLVEMYCKNGFLDEGIRVFVQLWSSKGNECLDPVTMAAIVRGCTLSKCLHYGKTFHGFLVKQGLFFCTFVQNSLIDMYGELEKVDSANQVFRGMSNKDIVSWNSMISCFLKNNNPVKALEVLTELQSTNVDGLAPDSITMLSLIQACAEIASLQHGEILHGYAIKLGFNSDVFVSNTLIDMYAKAGWIDSSEKVFNDMDLNDLSSWNTMILALGIHGDGKAALRVFNELKKCRFLIPNAITFVNVITACSHSGLVTEGYDCFKSMQKDLCIEPDMEHYVSVVDLFARSGKLYEAEDFIREMPAEPGAAIWGSLLGACGIYGDIEIAERAAEKLSVLEPDDNAWKVSLSNVYALAGRWKDSARIRAEMKRNGVKKKAGWSSIEVNSKESLRFMVGDTKHREADKIYEVWNALKDQIKHVAEVGS